jgi:hypothetical protein
MSTRSGAALLDHVERPRVMTDKLSEAAEQRELSIHQRAAAEAHALGPQHPWAGTYYLGDGRGVNVRLTLAPAAGFAFRWAGCLSIYDRNYGSIRCEGGRILLAPELPNTHEAFEGIHEELIPVRWGERHYLIAAHQFDDFCQAASSGVEPRSHPQGRFLLRDGDETKPIGVSTRARDFE